MSDFEPFLLEWKFARGLSLDLLSVLSNEDLDYTPGFGMGELWKQFRHVGRVQEDYVRALKTGKVEFRRRSRQAPARESADALREYLSACDEEMLIELSRIDQEEKIDWFGETVHAREHMWRLAAHETFHHGQWVIYMSGLEKSFPPSWSAWGL